jgi:hypothetical protein
MFPFFSKINFPILSLSILIALLIVAPPLSKAERASDVALRNTIDSNNFGDVAYDWAPNSPHQIQPPPNPSEARLHIDNKLAGFAWSTHVGWIALENDGTLEVDTSTPCPDNPNWDLVTGQAWGENFGWIDFTPQGDFYVCLDFVTGVFHGRGWSENVGEFVMEGVLVDAIDTDPIDFKITEEYFAADDAKELIFTFLLTGGTDIEEINFDFEVWNSDNFPTNKATYTQTSPEVSINGSEITILHNFRDVYTYEDEHGIRRYTIHAQVIDEASNITEKSFDVSVLANTFSPEHSDLSLNTDVLLVGDGEEKYSFEQLILRDQYDNPITHVDGIKSVYLTLNFTNTNDTNQVVNLDLGDSTCYYSDQFILGGEICGVDSFILDSADTITEGDFSDFQVGSVTPTSDIYPLTTVNNTITLDNLSLHSGAEITGDTVGDIGEEDVSLTPAHFANAPFTFSFLPALVNELRGPTSIADFPKQMIEGIQTEYNMYIKNDSSGIDITNIDVSTFCNLGDAVVDCYLTDADENIIAEGNGSFSLLADGINHYEFENLGMDYTDASANLGDAKYNQLLSHPNVTISSRIRPQYLTPTSLLGELSNLSATATLITQLGYKTDKFDDIIIYPGHTQQDINLLTRDIAVSGRVRSDIIGPVSFLNIGTINKETVIDAIYRDVASITRGAIIPEGGGAINSINDWDRNNIHALSTGNVLYFKNGDVTVGDITVLGQKTLIVEGGNVFLQGNITYNSPNDSLGIIILQGLASENKNLYIEPAVTDINCIAYVEGSVMSWHPGLNKPYDGFNTTGTDLLDQLYFHGTIISHNTLGGSRKDPPELPLGVSIAGFNLLPAIQQLKTAQAFDLKYLRQYVWDLDPDLPGNQATGIAAIGTTKNESVVIDYDSGIFNPTRVPPGFANAMAVSTEQI